MFTTGTVLLLASSVFTATYVVDDDGGPGVDFTDLPAAVAAAQPGDVLRVMPGSYSEFTCRKTITIVGYGGPTVSGETRVEFIPVGDRPCVLAGLTLTRLTVSTCSGPVIVERVASVERIVVASSLDVRLQDVHVPGSFVPGYHAMAVLGSRVEIVQSSLKGSDGQNLCGMLGGSGLYAADGSRIHFALSHATAGDGGDCPAAGPGGDGGPGVILNNGCELIAAGGGVGTIHGGGQGINQLAQDCDSDGRAGPGISASYSDVDYSRIDIWGPDWYQDRDCFYATGSPFIGFQSSFDRMFPPQATLALHGTPTAGHAVPLTLNGPAGSRASIWIGRRFFLQPEPNVDIELAVDRLRVIELGSIPASGSITHQLEVPGGYPIGTVYGVQGECRLESGLVRRSNSVPIVVR